MRQSLLQLSDESLDKVIDEATRVQPTLALGTEALSIFIENARLRRAANQYAANLMMKTVNKEEAATLASQAPKKRFCSFLD